MAIPRNLSILAQGASVSGVLSVTYGGTGVTTSTGTGSVVLSNSPSLTSPAVGSGNLTFSTTGQRITGDFSNATVANRVFVQTSTTNGNTTFAIVPNGTGTTANFAAYGNSADVANSSVMFAGVSSSGTEVRINSAISGTGTYLPMTFYTGGSERMRVLTTGEVGIGTSSPAWKLDIRGADAVAQVKATSGSATLIIDGFDGTSYPGINLSQGGVNYWSVQQRADTNLYLYRQSGSGAVLIPSGNVGIGTTSPSEKLSVHSAIGVRGSNFASTTYVGSSVNTTGVYTGLDSAGGFATNVRDAGYLTYSTNNIERMRIDSSGDVTISQSTGDRYLRIGANRSGNGYSYIDLQGDTTYANGLRLIRINSGANAPSSIEHRGTGSLQVVTQEAAPIVFFTNGANERARIDSSGNLLVGTTSQGGSYNGRFVSATGSGLNAWLAKDTQNNGAIASFVNNSNALAGTITISGTTTTYGTSSDYRLKENTQPITNGLSTISSLRPVTYDWKADKSKGEGFIAHELQVVIPLAVTGKKDAVNEDGSIKPQGVDYSKIVVHLVAAIQELTAKVAALEGKA